MAENYVKPLGAVRCVNLSRFYLRRQQHNAMNNNMRFLYNDRVMRIAGAESLDPTVLKVELMTNYPVSTAAVRFLIKQSHPEPETDPPPPIEFAGQHPGMPAQNIWAISRGGEPATEHLDLVIKSVQAALEQVEQTGSN